MAHQPQTSSRLGGNAFNHSSDAQAEQEYDRLRNLARQEKDRRGQLAQQSQQAYQRGEGGAAHEYSEKSKEHGRRADDYDRQASEFIFRENNAPGRVAADTIDLHGQYVAEAEQILETRIRAAKAQGQDHLHVIVGKGNHSVNHVQKIKPRVEQICREEGLQFHTEANEGRMYISLTGGPAQYQQMGQGGYQGQAGGQGQPGYPGGQQQYYNGGQPQSYGQPQQQYAGHQQQHHQGGQQHGQNQNDELEKLAKKFLPRIIRKLEGCCVIM